MTDYLNIRVFTNICLIQHKYSIILLDNNVIYIVENNNIT